MMKLQYSRGLRLLLAFSIGTLSLNTIQLPLYAAGDEENGIRMRPESIHEEHDKKENFNYKRQPKNQSSPKSVPKEKYSIRDYESCDPQKIEARFCDSIPEESRCPDGSAPIYRQILNDEDRLVRQYRYCAGDPPEIDLPEDSFIEEISIDINEFKEYPILASEISSNPNKFSLKNGHTHFWASEEVQSFTSNLSGSTVRIRAIPVQWNWDYGDGAGKTRDFPGEPAPNHTLRDETSTSHSYSDTGTFQVEVTTLYRGEFSVDGGAWQAIPGQAAVPSEPIEIDVWRTEKELIANE